jgi:hypothetical protein
LCRQDAAQKLYLKNGYQEVGREPWQGMTLILYEKQL